ncbi:Aldehyde dehydrogenase (NAD(+)) [Ascochyta rabiei]|uniref:Aldehyde dehydrogenase (NAD(+)) n=1 Tax=Didymella rabiei TaxID=5454 RepID=UPI0019020DC9|nr:Aldehyde dehydrogenase (NAD(+)) [Ascochyta rabiei]UPX18526.1 Aldehyde dehydrogenase (NAD(+)) [Ascochyta rabiei]
MAEITGPRPPSTSTRAANAHRVHSSCDRCRSRKTKCIDPIPGPCRYCARTGAPCTIATPRRKRPYYHVTEEEYQLSMSILSRVFPGQELNLQSLRKISKGIKDGSLVLPTLNADSYFESHESPEDDDGYSSADTPGEWSVDGDNLHEPLGSMMKDSKGVLRYVGAQSDIPFNGAVVNFCKTVQKTDIIPAARVGHYPPREESEKDVFYLPPKETCFHYVRRYREEVHCMYWLYPEEKLLQRIEDTYTWYAPPSTQGAIKHDNSGTPTPPLRRGERPSSSWICSLYAMFAIGASPRDRIDHSPSPGLPSHLAPKTSEDYLALVKQLKPKVEESADIDSIRALVISAIALENALSRVTAYLYIGTAVQTAFTLGLHRDQLPISGTEEDREENRRIWWTLFTLDLEIGMRGGSPSLIDERYVKITTLMPHERVPPSFLGLHTPLKWLSTFVSLSRLKREVIREIYTERESKLISFSTVSNLLLLLRKWHRTMPVHLRLDSWDTAPTYYRRAIMVLHLHYWSTKILLTRPFLLNLVLKRAELASTSKIGYEKMAMVSVDAARKIVELCQRMVQDQTISSLTTLDSTTVLRCVTIFMCAFGYFQKADHKKDANDCLAIAKNMEQTGFASMIVMETPMHLQNLGMSYQPTPDFHHESYVPDEQTIAEMWNNYQMTSLQTQQTLDLDFDDSGALDANTNILAFEYLDEPTKVFHSPQPYSDYDLWRRRQ